MLAGRTTLDDVVRTADEVAAGEDLDGVLRRCSTPATTPSATPLPASPTARACTPTTSTFLDDALDAAFMTRRTPAAEQGGVGWTVSTPTRHRRTGPRRGPAAAARGAAAVLPADGRVTGAARAGHHPDGRQRPAAHARDGKGVNDTTWPEAHYLGPLHPVLDWAATARWPHSAATRCSPSAATSTRRPCCCWAP